MIACTASAKTGSCKGWMSLNRQLGEESLNNKVVRGGFEPPTRGVSVHCSTN